MSILTVNNLSVSFHQYTSFFQRKQLEVISNLNVELKAGKILAVVGASGSGKSLLAHAILGVLPPNAHVSGTMNYEGEKLTKRRQEELRGKEIALVPQSVNFLNPLMRVGKQVQISANEGNTKQKQEEVFARYGLAPETAYMYPFQFSGGMARRALLATAIVSGAKVIIADEPTPGLDEEVMQVALANFKELADEGCAIMLITHDIHAALTIADEIAVFYAGTTVETAAVEDFSGKGEKLRHPYSRALWNALPENEFIPLAGTQPHPDNLPTGCLFAPRCPLATEICQEERPEMRDLHGGKVRCFHAT